jgi:hypothetical protein
MVIKQGDRVACYDVELTGYETGTIHRTIGTVVGQHAKGALLFAPDWDKDAKWPVHEKQLRRLRKRKRR